jgi:hypothetical protein
MTTKKKRYDLALSFWRASLQYLILVENVSRETASQGNIHLMGRDFKVGQITPEITPEEYADGTRWSDHTIIIPLLFNLLHGIELLVKGFILVDPSETVKMIHNIGELCARFKQKYPNQNIINNFLCKYTSENEMPELLRRFLMDNDIQVNILYKALRYPSDDFLTMRIYSSLKYQGEDGTPFFRQLSADISEVRLAAVRLGKSFEVVN